MRYCASVPSHSHCLPGTMFAYNTGAMSNARKVLVFIVLPCALLAVATVAYEFFIGFPEKV